MKWRVIVFVVAVLVGSATQRPGFRAWEPLAMGVLVYLFGELLRPYARTVFQRNVAVAGGRLPPGSNQAAHWAFKNWESFYTLFWLAVAVTVLLLDPVMYPQQP